MDHFFNAREEVSRNFLEAESKSQNYKKYKIWNSCWVLTFTSIQEMIGSVINGFFETGKHFIHFGFRDDQRRTAGNDSPGRVLRIRPCYWAFATRWAPVFWVGSKKGMRVAVWGVKGGGLWLWRWLALEGRGIWIMFRIIIRILKGKWIKPKKLAE